MMVKIHFHCFVFQSKFALQSSPNRLIIDPTHSFIDRWIYIDSGEEALAKTNKCINVVLNWLTEESDWQLPHRFRDGFYDEDKII